MIRTVDEEECPRCGALTKSDKIPMDSLIGTVIIERAIDMIVLLFLLFVIFIAKLESFGLFIKENVFILKKVLLRI